LRNDELRVRDNEKRSADDGQREPRQ
jgi:hypothetical protein